MTKLTLKQGKFVDAYIETRDAHESYSLAFDSKRMRPSSISTEGYRMLRHPQIALEIKRRLELIGETADEKLGFDAIQALSLFVDLARADPNELIGLRVGACRYCHGPDHQYQWTPAEFMAATALAERNEQPLPDVAGGLDFDRTLPPLPTCPECRGEGETRIVPMDTRNLSPGGKMLYQGVKQTKDGMQIILADKSKALENATKLIGGFLERVELSGGVAVGKPDLTGLSAADAAQKYSEFVRGK